MEIGGVSPAGGHSAGAARRKAGDLGKILERQIERRRVLEESTDQIIPWLFHRNGKQILSPGRASC